MQVENQPYQICRSHDISDAQLEAMVMGSAKFTHLWANRRYQGWIFDVDMDTMHVHRMGYYQAPATRDREVSA